jgi:DNA-directed RNA polymerase subunit RPC12/RpoP
MDAKWTLMPDEAVKWKEFRKRTLFYVVTLVCGAFPIFMASIVGLFTGHRAAGFIAALIFLALWSVPGWIATRRFVEWRCPRCGEPFVGWEGLRRVMPVNCFHCGQRAFASLD